MNKNMIIAIIVIILIAVVGYVFISGQTTDGKLNTQINFASASELQNGDQVVIELKDAKGTPLPNQMVNLTMSGNGAEQKYSVYTNAEGKAFLILNGEEPGEYEITAAYDGNDQLNPCTATQTITIGEGTSDQAATNTEDSNSTATSSSTSTNNETSTSTSSSSGQPSQSQATKTYYDEELNVYYDENGVIIGGQDAGANIYDLRNNPPQVDEQGNLV